jgi:hypothetical protein
MRLDTSSVQVPRCFKQLSHWTRLELDGRFKISNKIRLLAWSFRYHNRFKLPLLVDLVKIVFSSLGNVVAFSYLLLNCLPKFVDKESLKIPK